MSLPRYQICKPVIDEDQNINETRIKWHPAWEKGVIDGTMRTRSKQLHELDGDYEG